MSWSHIEPVLPWTDLFLYDLKLSDPAVHAQWVGGNHARIRASLQQLVSTGADVRVRVPLVPGVTDTDTNLSALAAEILAMARCAPGIVDLLSTGVLLEACATPGQNQRQ